MLIIYIITDGGGASQSMAQAQSMMQNGGRKYILNIDHRRLFLINLYQ